MARTVKNYAWIIVFSAILLLFTGVPFALADEQTTDPFAPVVGNESSNVTVESQQDQQGQTETNITTDNTDNATEQTSPADNATSVTASQSLETYVINAAEPEAPLIPGAGPLRDVSPKEFVGRINKMIGDVNAAVAGVIVPIAVFGMLVSCVVLSAGGIFSWQTAKRFGWGGLLMSSLGMLVFYGIPIIIGLIKALATYLGS